MIRLSTFLIILVGTMSWSGEITYFGPHLTSTTPWVNKITIFNSDSEPQNAQLLIWDTNGQVAYENTIQLDSNDSETFVLTSFYSYQTKEGEMLLDPVQGAFSVTVTDEKVVSTLSFQYGNQPSVSSFFLSERTGYGFLLPNMQLEHFDWAGAAISNPYENTLTIELKAFHGGTLKAQTTKAIPGYSKLVATADTIWPGLDMDGFDQMTITSSTEFPAPILISGNATQDRHLFFMGTCIQSEASDESKLSYPIVGTNQSDFYDANREMSAPSEGQPFYGQDAQYSSNSPNYTDNGDGTITDQMTGLMWQKDPGSKKTYAQAVEDAGSLTLAGYDDWRLPSIKELYSLILFSGIDPSGYSGQDTSGLTPFIDSVFDFEYGDPSVGERIIDSQFATSTLYVDTTMNGDETMFGVNFADGRIKGYGTGPMPGSNSGKTFFTLYVRGNPDYGTNRFVDNGNGTVSDTSTGLMWLQQDSGFFAVGDRGDGALSWEQALAFSENLEYEGYSDWRLPTAKELQSIVDYSRAPGITGTAAIDPMFDCSSINNELGQADYPCYWSSTTHASWASDRRGSNAAYVAFGRGMGYMNGTWMDVHGAGCQRSDPKEGDPSDYPTGHGPQGDAIRIFNFVRCVRTIN